MRSAADEAHGATSPPTARRQPPGVPSVQMITPQASTVEPQVWEEGRIFPGQCVILEEGPALDNAKSWYVNA